MASAFDGSTPVVDFNPTTFPLHRAAHRWILWPVLAYKVLIPVRKERTFNLFQRAALDFARAGVRGPAEIARRLALPEDLVTFVGDQLRGMAMLEESGAPTPRALRLMEDEDDPVGAEDAGYVFLDALTRRLWPRVHLGSLPFVEAKFEGEGLSIVTRGPEGHPERIRATVLRPKFGGSEQAPTALAILKAARQHVRRTREYARESSHAEGTGDGQLRPLDGGLSGLRRVRLIGSQPEPVLVTAFVFLPSDRRQSSWLVTDPCGLGVTGLLRGAIEQLATSRDDPTVRRLIERLTGEAWHIDQGDLAWYLEDANRAARQRVANWLGDAVSLLSPDVVQRLANAEERLEQARLRSTASTRYVEDFLGHAWAALEGVLLGVMELHPDVRLLEALRGCDSFSRARARRAIMRPWKTTTRFSPFPLA